MAAQVEDYLKDVVNNQTDDVEEIHVQPSEAFNEGTRRSSKQTTVSDEQPQYAQPQPSSSAMPSSKEKPTNFSFEENDSPGNQLIDIGLSETLPPFEMMEEL